LGRQRLAVSEGNREVVPVTEDPLKCVRLVGVTMLRNARCQVDVAGRDAMKDEREAGVVRRGRAPPARTYA
jgi:hypothetical protein